MQPAAPSPGQYADNNDRHMDAIHSNTGSQGLVVSLCCPAGVVVAFRCYLDFYGTMGSHCQHSRMSYAGNQARVKAAPASY